MSVKRFDATEIMAANRAGFWPEVSDEQWDDWRWQNGHRITTVRQLERFLPWMDARTRAGLGLVQEEFATSITPYYMSLIDADNPADPIGLQALPDVRELAEARVAVDDPLGEEDNMVVPGLVHRYRDRALLIATWTCSMYCRFCTRKRNWRDTDVILDERGLDRVCDYLREHGEVRDIVLSGGDPLTLGTRVLEMILRRLREVPTIEIIRIGTRIPVVMPQKITPELCEVLRQYHPLWVNTHFNHPRELTPAATKACDLLSRAGIPLNNQSVLLRGVNDDVPTMLALCTGLMRLRVRPYYLYHCDPIRGSEHMRTSVWKGIEMMEHLRGHTSGLAVPTYVVDAPKGGGKIPVGPNYLLSMREGEVWLRNYKNRVFQYTFPNQDSEAEPSPQEQPAIPVTVELAAPVR